MLYFCRTNHTIPLPELMGSCVAWALIIWTTLFSASNYFLWIQYSLTVFIAAAIHSSLCIHEELASGFSLYPIPQLLNAYAKIMYYLHKACISPLGRLYALHLIQSYISDMIHLKYYINDYCWVVKLISCFGEPFPDFLEYFLPVVLIESTLNS